MKTMEKVKLLNQGMALQRMVSHKGKSAEIYCGDEDRAEFLIEALGKLGIYAECDVFTTDGEYFVEVKL